jgi:inhibitor of KinA
MPKHFSSGLRFEAASDQSLLVYFGDGISRAVNAHVLKTLRMMQAQPIAGVRDLHPAYASLLINFDCFALTHAQLERIVRKYFERAEAAPLPEPRRVEIPVCYGGEFGPDLDDVAAAHGLAPSKVVKLHSSAEYFVYFLGFAPGFAYLAGLPDELATPRLAKPRKRIPAGSVGIAGNQTAVYPFATPGGWQLIGRTPVSMFRAGREPMSLLAMGDVVRFKPISPEEFAAHGSSIE